MTLGVVLDADQTLRFPDFRAEERTFALITQLAGRTGRGERGGRVLVQTLAPDARAIAFASRHDSDGFLADELAPPGGPELSALRHADPDRLLGDRGAPRARDRAGDRRPASDPRGVRARPGAAVSGSAGGRAASSWSRRPTAAPRSRPPAARSTPSLRRRLAAASASASTSIPSRGSSGRARRTAGAEPSPLN